MANYTEKAILATFEEMLSRTPLDRITVTALAKECGISPNTFYYHFQDIYDLLDRWMLSKFADYNRVIQDLPDWGEMLKYILHRLRDHSRLVFNITDSLSREQLERFIFTRAEDIFLNVVREQGGETLSEDTARQIAEFYCYSVLGFILRFIWQRMNVDIDREVDSLYALFRDSVDTLLHPQDRTDVG